MLPVANNLSEQTDQSAPTNEENDRHVQDPAQSADTALEDGDNALGGNADDNTEAGDVTDDNQQSGVNYSSGNMSSNFNGMNYAGADMNQMQMMMAMQNGMNPAAFGSFPMSGTRPTPEQLKIP